MVDEFFVPIVAASLYCIVIKNINNETRSLVAALTCLIYHLGTSLITFFSIGFYHSKIGFLESLSMNGWSVVPLEVLAAFALWCNVGGRWFSKILMIFGLLSATNSRRKYLACLEELEESLFVVMYPSMLCDVVFGLALYFVVNESVW